MTIPSEIVQWMKICVLGEGSFGKVTLWRNRDTEEEIAIKTCKANLSSSKLGERWQREIDLIENSRNPNIIAYKTLPYKFALILEKYNTSGLPLLPMEYCTGGNLRHVLMDPENSCGLKEVVVKTILLDLQNGISYLHAHNITHRDLKPENVVLKNNPQSQCGWTYKLIDLGYAKELDSIGFSVVGTMPYLAPEIIANKKYNKSVDYWSFGVLAYEVICGQHPFLPQLSIPKRMDLIQKKSKGDIAIVLNDDGSPKYISEISRAVKINSCMKNDLQRWLRYCFNLDHEKRATYNIFQDLKDILNKLVVTVYSVFTSEVYNYEYDESTLMTTLQDWIQRDTKITKVEQLLLTKNNITNMYSDGCTIMNALENHYETFYVFKRGELCATNVDIPPIITKLLQNKFVDNWEMVKMYYCHTLHFIFTQCQYVEMLRQSVFYLIKHMKAVLMSEFKAFTQLSNNMIKLTHICEYLNGIEEKFLYQEIVLKSSFLQILTKQKQCLIGAKQLFTHLKQISDQHQDFQRRRVILQRGIHQMRIVFDSCQMEDIYQQALETTKEDKGGKNLHCNTIRRLIHDLLKCRHDLLKNPGFCGLVANVWEIEMLNVSLLGRYKNFDRCTLNIIGNMEKIHLNKLTILVNEVRFHSLNEISDSLNSRTDHCLPAQDLIKESRALIEKSDRLNEEFSNMAVDVKNYFYNIDII